MQLGLRVSLREIDSLLSKTHAGDSRLHTGISFLIRPRRQATTEATPATPDATEVAAPSAGTRSDMVETAVKFLQNPKVKDAALSQKTAFLEKKGLTAAEIQLALDTVGGGGGGLGGAGAFTSWHSIWYW